MNKFSHLRDGSSGGGVGMAAKAEEDNNNGGSPDDNNIPIVPIPNSKPREPDPDEDTYSYRDFATIPSPSLGGAQLHPQSLQAQKLPAKLASMLSDQILSSLILWIPHGRSWRVLNRDLFAEHALPRYFGHKNYASFVRIVNAWGFRRITRGPDRDSYYHELFLRGRPNLHQRMKRLSTCHRKTPVNKDVKCPDFYELAKTSPLPEVSFQMGGQAAGGGGTGAGAGAGGINPGTQFRPPISASSGSMTQFSPHHNGLQGSSMGSLTALGNRLGNLNEQVFSMLSNNRSMNPTNATSGLHQSMGTSMGTADSSDQPSMPRLAQLQRDNDDLRRRIMEMEKNQCGGGGGGNQLGRNPMIPDQLATLSANLGGGNNGFSAGNNGGGDMLENELKRMQRDLMMRSNTPSMNNTLLSNLSGAPSGGVGNPAPAQGGGAREFSFMPSFPRDEMLLHAMRQNQMGLRGGQQQQQEWALQHQGGNVGGPMSSTPLTAPTPGGNDADRAKAMMDWMKQQQHQV